MSDRRYRYRVFQPNGGRWYALIGGMQNDAMDLVERGGKPAAYRTEADALRGAMDTILGIIHRDIVAWRVPGDPCEADLAAKVMGDARFIRGRKVMVERRGKQHA